MATKKNTRTDQLTPWEPGQSGNPKGRPKGSKNRPSTLTVAEAMVATTLEQKGHSESAIARLLNAKPEAVKEALTNSRKLLDQFAPEFARHWRIASHRAAKKGDHRPAMAALQSVEAVKPIAQTYDTGQGAGAKAVAAVQVRFEGFGFAGLPPQPQPPEQQPAIEVTARSGT